MSQRTTARDKSATHVPTAQSCDTCHRTTGLDTCNLQSCWRCSRHLRYLPQRYDQLEGKSATHLPTTQSCDTCHRTAGWTPADVQSLPGVAAGTCATCHNGTTAARQGQRPICRRRSRCDTCHTHHRVDARHLQSYSVLQPRHLCHLSATALRRVANQRNISRQRRVATPVIRTTGWTPATFSQHRRCCWHLCHLPPTAPQHVAKSGNHHIPTTQSCDTCHRTDGLDAGDDDHHRVSLLAPVPLAITVRPTQWQTVPRICRRRRVAIPAIARRAGRRRPSATTGVVAGTCATLSQRHDCSRQAGHRIADDTELRYLSSQLRAGRRRPSAILGGRRWHLRHLPQRYHRSRQTGHAHCPTTQVLRYLSPHLTGWTPATFSPHGRGRGTCADLPQRNDGAGASADALSDDAKSCDTCHRTTALDAGDVQSHRCRSGDLCDLPQRHQCDRQIWLHFVTTRSCDACHRTTGWTPTRRPTHTSIELQGA